MIDQRYRRIGATIAVLACGAGGLAACGADGPTMSTAAVARSIEGALAKRGVSVPVQCPASVPRRAGTTFGCRARLGVGSYHVTVVEIDDRGRVRYQSAEPLAVLDSAKIAAAIEASIRRQRGLSARARCPQPILQRAGIVFPCSVAVAGLGRYEFRVRELDDSGHVRYEGSATRT